MFVKENPGKKHIFFIVHIKSSLILGRSFPHAYIVLPSAKKKILLMNLLNKSGPNIEPCGIPWQISDHLLYEEPTLVLWFLKLR